MSYELAYWFRKKSSRVCMTEEQKEVNMFTAEMNGQKEVNTWNVPIDDPTIDDQIGDYFREKA